MKNKPLMIALVTLFLDVVMIGAGIIAAYDILDKFPYDDPSMDFELAVMQVKALIISADIIAVSIITAIGGKCILDELRK